MPELQDTIYSCSWNIDGTAIAMSCKDRKIRIADPRAKKITHESESHSSQRESLVTFLKDSNKIVSSGFDSSRQRQVCLRDLRNFQKVQNTLTFDSSTGILLPLHDVDTGMTFLCGKTDTSIFYYEIGDKEPFFAEGLKHTGQQMKGACLVPKRALNVMEGEVNRILQLVAGGVVPVSYIVPRKSYRDYHADLFPETNGYDPPLTAQQWADGMNRSVSKVSLDPNMWKERPQKIVRGPLMQRREDPLEVKNGVVSSGISMTDGNESLPVKLSQQKNENLLPKPKPRIWSAPRSSLDAAPVPQPRVPSIKRTFSLRASGPFEYKKDALPMLRRSDSLRKRSDSLSLNNDTYSKDQRKFAPASKYKHLKGKVLRDKHIENIKGFDQSLPAECDGIQVNARRIAIPLSGPGGRVAIFNLENTGKIGSGVVPALVSGYKVMDLAWDPFDDSRIAIACEDSRLRIWIIPEKGLTDSSNVPDLIIESHSSAGKISLVKFHPLAKDVVAAVTSDHRIRIWDFKLPTEPKIVINSHGDQIFSIAWSPCGKFLASVSKDSLLRIFEPRTCSSKPIREGPGPTGKKGARIFWALDGELVCVTGFDKSSERHLTLYKSDDLNIPFQTTTFDTSPVLLIPYYDEDSSTVFITGKMGYFQDDLFPPTRKLWCPTMSSDEWFASKNKEPPRVSLQPEGMPNLYGLNEAMPKLPESGVKASVPSPKIENRWQKEQPKKTEEDIQRVISDRLAVDLRLEQDNREGVEESEWAEE
ncbi:hypothetical protein QYM36_010792 [Artemia franciscana]|uniref:Coronin n=1 Tax=Artemia franciscana TaxID=6661 RepID=A0AA88L802_ARTSF|nr:hypothetical protein QYM36_010792 [Artemia franciscana]